MSAEPTESSNPFFSLAGNVFLVLVPLSLVVMLGYVGFGFLVGMRDARPKAEPAPVVAAAVPSAAPAPAPAAEEGPAPADGGGSPGEPAAAIDPDVMKLGKASYATCAACHGPDGAGIKAGPALMAPSLIGSELLLGDPDKSLLVILKGIAKENMDYMGMMAPLGAALNDEQLAAVLTYTRNEWGNSAPPVTVEQAAAARAKFASIDAPAGVKRGEIEKIVEAHR